MKNKRLFIILSSLLALLLIPFIAMRFTDEVNWSGVDFLVMGALLLCVGLAIDFILKRVTKPSKRLALIATVIIGFVMIWAELAVGIF
jgi:hypothetical protein